MAVILPGFTPPRYTAQKLTSKGPLRRVRHLLTHSLQYLEPSIGLRVILFDKDHAGGLLLRHGLLEPITVARAMELLR